MDDRKVSHRKVLLRAPEEALACLLACLPVCLRCATCRTESLSSAAAAGIHAAGSSIVFFLVFSTEIQIEKLSVACSLVGRLLPSAASTRRGRAICVTLFLSMHEAPFRSSEDFSLTSSEGAFT